MAAVTSDGIKSVYLSFTTFSSIPTMNLKEKLTRQDLWGIFNLLSSNIIQATLQPRSKINTRLLALAFLFANNIT